ncbi:MAG: sugar phosphate isomerase/epimerase, partial [Planctomycetales bacterium]|nr:sugar phosphate isomerase/epimerase [Planctomycetales bacterium]
GLVPPEFRAERLQEMLEISDFARLLGCDVIALHLGFVPHDTTQQLYQDVLQVTRQLCEHAAQNDQALHLETGQETGDALLAFISDTKCDNLFINFDPANMILYGTGEPIETLKQVGHLVRSVHCKDATWSDQPGKTWGREVPLGEGQVDIEKYLQALKEIGYSGPLTIEREIPQEPARQKAEIDHASSLLSKLKEKVLA